jgi:hypothetical protein
VRRVEGVEDAGAIYTSTTEITSLPEPSESIHAWVSEPGRPGMPAIVEGREFRTGEAREAVMDRNVALAY